MSNYALDTPILKNTPVTDWDIPFAPAYTPPHSNQMDQSHRRMNWLFDARQHTVAHQNHPKSARLDKKK